MFDLIFLPEKLQSLRTEMRKSRFKIWLRAVLFVQFAAIFSVYLFHDISRGYFKWEWVAWVFLLCVPVGLLLSLLVPMRADPEVCAVVLSLDPVYLVLIWVLVLIKLITAAIPSVVYISDGCMMIILGIMAGRLGGIGLRVRKLKIDYGFRR